MKKLYKFEKDFGRMGEISGVFVAEQDEIDALIGKTVYFGEALGKHSDISVKLTNDHFTVKSEDEEFIEKLCRVFGGSNISGYNPLDYQE